MTTRLALLLALALSMAACGSSTDNPSTAPRPAAPSDGPAATPSDGPAAAPSDGPALAPTTGEPSARPTAEQLATFASASNAFAFDLYAKARAGRGNLAFSPASIQLALQMTWAGAHGPTAEEMARVLHLDASPDAQHEAAGRILAMWNDPARESYELRVVNRLFGERTYDFASDFIALTGAHYGAPFERVNFRGDADAERTRINRWVEEQTNERITDLLPAGSLDPQTRMVLVNAIYFLGKWKHRFSEDATRERPFHTPGGERAVPMMNQTQSHPYARVDGVHVLQMPYRGDELAMMLVLPQTRGELAAVEERLDADRLARWVAALRPQRVSVSVPRFEIDDAELPLTAMLPELGMTLAFDDAQADFRGMVSDQDQNPGLFISDAFHKAFVKVDEEGTEAAAATAVVMAERSLARPAAFVADHPFLFFIRDLSSGTILFMGRVEDPTA